MPDTEPTTLPETTDPLPSLPVPPRSSVMEFEPLPEEPVDTEEPPVEQKLEEKPIPTAAPVIRHGFDLPTPSMTQGAPPWALIPSGLKFPRGKSIMFFRFKSRLTDAPWKGNPHADENGQLITETTYVNGQEVTEVVLFRQCIVWPLNVADKRLAMGRSLGDNERAFEELTRQMIRIVDGEQVSWAMAGPIDVFWNDLGEKCRGLLGRIYTKLHVLAPEDQLDFFANCVVARTAAG